MPWFFVCLFCFVLCKLWTLMLFMYWQYSSQGFCDGTLLSYICGVICKTEGDVCVGFAFL